jgi:hypothetical protein
MCDSPAGSSIAPETRSAMRRSRSTRNRGKGTKARWARWLRTPHGRFAYVLEASASQTLRFVYPGTATRLPAEDKVALLVAGRSTFAVNHSRISNGQTVTFSGRVQGKPLPPTGKLLELQVRLPGEWETFRTIRSEPDGRWRIRYQFRRTCGVQSYELRIRLPGEAGYGLSSGASRVLTVRVKGRPCFTG